MRAFLIILALFASQIQASTIYEKAAHAGWIARDNEISRMAPEEFVRMLGAPKDEAPEAQFFAIEQGTRGRLPAAVDWRDQKGADWVTPILNQGKCGSCVAFAAIATMETQYRIDAGISTLKVRLSPQHLFSCGGGSCFWGWDPATAARYLKENGVPDEACFPYESGNSGYSGSCSNTCADYESRSVHLADYGTPTSGAIDIDAIKKALQDGPVVTLLSLYDDLRYYTGGIYKHVSGGYRSGHAVSIIGYNDAQRYWIIRNSWGKGWGEGGFGRISYDDTSGTGGNTWSYSVAVPKSAPTMRTSGQLLGITLTESQPFKGRVKMDVVADFNGDQLSELEFHWIGPNGKEIVKRAHNAPIRTTLAWNTDMLKPGVYEIWLVARADGQEVRTARTTVTVR